MRHPGGGATANTPPYCLTVSLKRRYTYERKGVGTEHRRTPRQESQSAGLHRLPTPPPRSAPARPPGPHPKGRRSLRSPAMSPHALPTPCVPAPRRLARTMRAQWPTPCHAPPPHHARPPMRHPMGCPPPPPPAHPTMRSVGAPECPARGWGTPGRPCPPGDPEMRGSGRAGRMRPPPFDASRPGRRGAGSPGKPVEGSGRAPVSSGGNPAREGTGPGWGGGGDLRPPETARNGPARHFARAGPPATGTMVSGVWVEGWCARAREQLRGAPVRPARTWMGVPHAATPFPPPRRQNETPLAAAGPALPPLTV